MDLMNEKEKLAKELYFRGWITAITGLVIFASLIIASKIMADNGLYGIPQIVTLGMSGFTATIIANGIFSIINSKKILK